MNEQFYREFGRTLREHRQRTGGELSQEQLAKRVGLSRTSITNIEKGRQQIPLHMLYLLADALGVDPISLLPDKRRLGASGSTASDDLPADVAAFLERVEATGRS